MTPELAADLAARTKAAIPHDTDLWLAAVYAADRERVDSDLAGLQHCWTTATGYVHPWHEPHLDRYAAGLIRTAALYGEAP